MFVLSGWRAGWQLSIISRAAACKTLAYAQLRGAPCFSVIGLSAGNVRASRIAMLRYYVGWRYAPADRSLGETIDYASVYNPSHVVF